ncbi:MAG: RHS repeat-associated core domain-containing protein [Anaerolineaceae bacterium]|nr:RHS repeat-associated core domain-containing protein [Anaerolineaceae bacterium]
MKLLLTPGNRLSRTVDGVTTTNYTLDIVTPLTQVLDDGTNEYLYGLDRIAQEDTGGMLYFISDALGSVRQLVDASGTLVNSATYTPYGESTGMAETSYGFTGEWEDPYDELLYLRSRYYSVETGRFLSRDTWQGDYTRTVPLNKWMYVEGNPVNYTDPSGYFSRKTLIRTFGVSTWSDVLEIFEKNGQSWNFLKLLRDAELGDHVYWKFQASRFNEWDFNSDDYVGVFHTGLFGYIMLEGEYVNANSLKHTQGDYGLYGNPTMINSMKKELYDNSEIFTSYDFRQVDWLGVTLDAAGIAADCLTLGVGGRIINAVEVGEKAGRVVGTFDLNFGGLNAAFDPSIHNSIGVSIDVSATGLDVVGVEVPILSDFAGLLLGFSEGLIIH